MTKLKLFGFFIIVIILLVLWMSIWHGETIKDYPLVENNPIEDEVIYTRDMTKLNLIEKVDALVGDYNISSAIVEECTTQVPDNYKKCIQDVIGVSNAESTMFKKWMSPSQNWFGLMYKGQKRRFSSVEESINVRVSLYVKNNWVKRATSKDWLDRWHYCTSACTYRWKNFTSAVKKLELD